MRPTKSKITHILMQVCSNAKFLKFFTKNKKNTRSKKRAKINRHMHNLYIFHKKRKDKKKLEAEHKFTDLYIQMIRAIESKNLYLDSRLTQEDVVRYLGHQPGISLYGTKIALRYKF